MFKRVLIIGLVLLTLAAALPYAAGDKYDPTTLVFPTFMHTMGIRKATKTHLLIYTRGRVKVSDPQGIAVVRLRSWEDSKSKKDDDEVTGYGVNSGENLVVYNKSMTSLGFYGKNERGVRKLDNPKGITANEKGDVYVADTGNHRIVRFYNPKQELKFRAAFGGFGVLPGQFQEPEGVAMDSSGLVYVADTGNNRIQVLRPDNKLHLWFGKQGKNPGELWRPTGIAVTDGKEKWSHYKDSFIVVVDQEGSRIQKFTLEGEFIKSRTLADLNLKKGKMTYVALDYYSNIWVTDTVNGCIHKFDHNLEFLTTFGRPGDNDKEFESPRGISIYKRFGQVFIAEKESAQYYWIGTDIFDFSAQQTKERRGIELKCFLTEPSYLTLRLEKGSEKRLILERQRYFTGRQSIVLNAKTLLSALSDETRSLPSDPALLRIPAGEYKFALKVEPTYSSINYFAKEVETSIRIP